jgi:hypothetical protein
LDVKGAIEVGGECNLDVKGAIEVGAECNLDVEGTGTLDQKKEMTNAASADPCSRTSEMM